MHGSRGAYRDKRARTRRRLLRAGVVLLADRGLTALNVAGVAAEAEVAPGTFYTYFESKEALVAAIVERLAAGAQRRAELVLAEAVAADSDDPARPLAAVVADVLAAVDDDPTAARALLELVEELPELRELVRRVLSLAIATVPGGGGDGRAPDIDEVERSVGLVADAVMGVVLQAVRSRLDGRTERAADAATVALVLRLVVRAQPSMGDHDLVTPVLG
jgi:AcrR family transcriptional regulator